MLHIPKSVRDFVQGVRGRERTARDAHEAHASRHEPIGVLPRSDSGPRRPSRIGASDELSAAVNRWMQAIYHDQPSGVDLAAWRALSRESGAVDFAEFLERLCGDLRFADYTTRGPFTRTVLRMLERLQSDAALRQQSFAAISGAIAAGNFQAARALEQIQDHMQEAPLAGPGIEGMSSVSPVADEDPDLMPPPYSCEEGDPPPYSLHDPI